MQKNEYNSGNNHGDSVFLKFSVSTGCRLDGDIICFHSHNTKNDGKISYIGVDSLLAGVIIRAIVAGFVTPENSPQ